MEFVLQSLQFLKLVSQFPLSKTDKWYVFIDFIFIILIVKPSIFTHSKPHTMPHTRLLKRFVLQHSVIKTKHLRSLVRGIIRGFEWVEILGFRGTSNPTSTSQHFHYKEKNEERLTEWEEVRRYKNLVSHTYCTSLKYKILY